MPLEEMTISISADRHVTFQGNFSFEYIPTSVSSMQFPLPPVHATNIRVYQDSVAVPWVTSANLYPTVLPEYPQLPMIEWQGPFPVDGAVFTVEYEHDLFGRDGELIFFYSLGTGKYFPIYEKNTTALFAISFPAGYLPVEILLDTTPIDPDNYSLTATGLHMTLTSQFGPFTKDLIVAYAVPEPATFLLVGASLLGFIGFKRCTKGEEMGVRSHHVITTEGVQI
jgi:hypothetical protein